MDNNKTFSVISISLAVLGCVLLVIAGLSASWMVGCMKYETVANITEDISDVDNTMNEEEESELDLGNQLLKGTDFCIHIGIFKLAMHAGSFMNINLGIDITSMPKPVLFGAVFLAMALLSGIVAILILIVAMIGKQGRYDGKSIVGRRIRYGLTLLVAAGVCTIAGMSAYTHGTIQSVHNPLLFMASLGQSVSHIFSGETSFGRGKRDVSLDGLGLDDKTKQILSTIFDEMDPMYGYAFFIGWLAAVVLLVAAVFSALAKKTLSRDPY